jgi:hypothetical protein
LRKNQKLNIDFKDDPFVLNWYTAEERDKGIKSLFKVLNIDTLSEAYKDMSDWMHWNIRGFGVITKQDNFTFGFNYSNINNALYSFSTGILSFTHSFCLLIKHLKLDFEDEYCKLRDEYSDRLFNQVK